MNYEIAVFEIDWFEHDGSVHFKNYQPIGLVKTHTETGLDIELLYILCNTNNSNNVLWQMLKNREDKHYMLVCAKQSPYTGRYGYFGYSIISKRRDMIFWDNKYMNLGNMNNYNIASRDPIEEVRRGNWRKIPGGEDLQRAFKQMGLERISLEKFKEMKEQYESGQRDTKNPAKDFNQATA